MALDAALGPVLSKIAPQVSVATLKDYWFKNDAKLNSGLIAPITQLRALGWKTYLATNQEHERATYLLHDLGLERLCDDAIWSARVGHAKPSAQFFYRSAEITNAPAAAHLLVDDTIENVDAARNEGWASLHWTPQMTGQHLLNAAYNHHQAWQN